MVKFVKPGLLVGGFNEYALLDFVDDMSDVDVLVYYEYQRKHFDLIKNYFPPQLWQECPIEDTLERTVDSFDSKIYSDYFKYMIVKFLQKNEYDPESFSEFLNSPKPLVKPFESSIIRHYEIRKYYQTMIIDMDLGNGNKWNRFYGLPPSFFEYSLLENVLDHLMEEGVVRFINSSLWDVLELVDGFEEVEENVYRKMKTKKQVYKKPRMYL